MWETISSILTKYWIEFLLGLIAAGISFFVKRYYTLDKANRQSKQDEHYKTLFKEIQKENVQYFEELQKENVKRFNSLEEDIKQNAQHDEKVDTMMAGILSLQGKDFKNECRRLLEDGHEITLDEWEDLEEEHNVYNGLGGNHKGDALFELVSKKAEKILTNKE